MRAETSDVFLGNAVIYCQGALATTWGKTAHGLVRHTERFKVLSVVDSDQAGRDAGEVIDGKRRGVPVLTGVREAVEAAAAAGEPADFLVIGLAPDGGVLDAGARAAVLEAVGLGLGVCAGMHDFLSDDPEISGLAAEKDVRLVDVRRPPPRGELHFFSGKIEEVTSLKVAVLGTDSAVGKRTTAVILIEALRAAGRSAEMVGTGQTSWMQGCRYSMILDSLVNDFVAGEIEHATWRAWKDLSPDVIFIEGQGSLLNPAFPGGFEILAAARPDAVILQHAPARKDYDGFPGYAIHPLEKQIAALELVSGKPVAAVTVNSEGLDAAGTAAACGEITRSTGLPACDVVRGGPGPLLDVVQRLLESRDETTDEHR
ncbi:MAG: DUF1611 domain-containing protein [Planctomycetota bacterium]